MIRSLLQFIEQVLVYAYVTQIPFSWRIILDPSRSRFNSGFNEYMDVSVYIGEILLMIALLIHIIGNEITVKSIHKSIARWINNMFHVERPILPILLLVFLFINLLTSIDLQLSIVSMFHFVLILIAMFLIQYQYVSRGTKFIRDLSLIFIISIITQLILAAYQVISGSSAGLWPINEPILSLDGINVAKSHIFEYLVLRGYGTFPHPNVLAAYSLLVIVFTYTFRDILFHVKHSVAFLTIPICIILIFLTQSKLIIIFSIIVLLMVYRQQIGSMFHVKHVNIALILTVFFFMVLFVRDINVSTNTRLSQAIYQVGSYTPTLFGTGIGTYRISYDGIFMEWWNYEPIHFVPYIILSEMGVIPVIILLVLLWKFIRNVPRETLGIIRIPTLFIAYILSIDHYAWDIYQGLFIGGMLVWMIYNIDNNQIRLYYNNLLK